MTFKDKHALETLPATMAKLQVEIRTLQSRLGDGGLYARDPARFSKLTAALVKAQNDLAEREEDWLRLEMLREEVEG